MSLLRKMKPQRTDLLSDDEKRDDDNTITSDKVNEAVKIGEDRTRIDNSVGYIRNTAGSWVIIFFTFMIDIIYGFYTIFGTVTATQISMNGTLYQVVNPGGSVDVVQVGPGVATLIDMSTVDSSYDGTSLSGGYLPTNLAVNLYTRMGGAADYFSTTYSSIFTNSFTFMGNEFGYGGLLEILIPGPPTYMVSVSFVSVLLITALTIAYIVAFLVQWGQNFRVMSATNANTALAYVSSFFIQLSGMITFLSIMDNGVTDLYCMVFGIAFLAETGKWMSYRYVDTEKAYLETRTATGNIVLSNYVSYRKNLCNMNFMKTTVYFFFNLVIVTIFALRSQNWGYQGDIGSWPASQYSPMVSSFMKAYIWTYLGGGCIVFSILYYATMCIKTGELLTYVSKKVNGGEEVEFDQPTERAPLFKSIDQRKAAGERGEKLFYRGTNLYVFSEYVMTFMGTTVDQSDYFYERTERIIMIVTNMYNMAIIFVMAMIINLGTHTNANGVTP